MTNANKNTMDMTHGSLLPAILKFTLPLLLTGTLQLLYNAADIVVVGRFASDNSLAAVSSTGPLINLIVNVFMGLSIGASVVVSQNFGAGKYKDVGEAVHTAIAISLISGVVVGIFGFFASKGMLQLMDSPENVIGLSDIYVKIYFIGMPANMLYNFGAAIMRAVGDTKRPLYYLMFSGLINVILNLIFVIVFHMDVAGVALATIASQIISAFLVIRHMIKSDSVIKFEIKKMKIHKDKLLTIVAVGLPAGIQGSLFSISNVIIQSSVNGFGSDAMAGNGAAGNIEGFIYVAMNSLHQAAVTFTGQNYGAKKFNRIKTVCLECMGLVAAVGLAMGALMSIFDSQLLSIYTDNPAEIEFGIVRISVIALTYFLCGTMDVMVGMLRGIGQSLTPTIVSISCVCGFRILWIFTVFAGYKAAGHTVNDCLAMLYISYPISWLAATVTHIGCFAFLYRRMFKQPEKEELEICSAE